MKKHEKHFKNPKKRAEAISKALKLFHEKNPHFASNRLTKDVCKKISIANTGHTFSIERRMAISKALTGKKHTDESKKKMSMAHKGSIAWNKGLKGYMAGEKNPFWKGGISKINKTERELSMQTIEYKEWRNAVFKRDNWTCQICFQRGGKLNADHIMKYIDYPELRLVLSNGRTLCDKCHRTTETYGCVIRNEKGQFSTMRLSKI